MRIIRLAALFGVLGICLAGVSLPRLAWSQESGAAAKEQEPEPKHELLFKTINFAILFGVLGYILRKPAGEFFHSRSAAIQASLAEGRKALEASQARLQNVEAKLAQLEADIAAFKDSALREMEAERERMQQTAAQESARLVESARRQTETTLRAAKLELKNYAAQKSVALAEQMIRTRLDDSAQRRLVTQFAASLEAKERKN